MSIYNHTLLTATRTYSVYICVTCPHNYQADSGTEYNRQYIHGSKTGKYPEDNKNTCIIAD